MPKGVAASGALGDGVRTWRAEVAGDVGIPTQYQLLLVISLFPEFLHVPYWVRKKLPIANSIIPYILVPAHWFNQVSCVAWRISGRSQGPPAAWGERVNPAPLPKKTKKAFWMVQQRFKNTIPRHSMGLPYMPTLTPKTTPTDR